MFNIASEASYGYTLSGQNFIKNGKFWRVFENLKLKVKQCYQTGKLLVENVKIGKLKWDIFGDFQTVAVLWSL